MTKMLDELKNDLADRGAAYGLFRDQAILSQALKFVCKQLLRANVKYLSLSRDEKATFDEGLDMVLYKIARLCNGSPLHRDSWKDIAGYAAIVVRDTEKSE